jgi:hypothetical protein
MARHESEREDLLREATALVERIELCVKDASDAAHGQSHIVAGFRANDALSIYFGSDPVYQFNAAGELRRAYCDGLLFKAAGRRLTSLRRVRQSDTVQLVRHDLTDQEQQSFVERMQMLFTTLANDLAGGRYRVVGQVPRGTDVVGRVSRWLSDHDGLPIAATPRV